MSRTKHRQNAFQWNPPPLPRDKQTPFDPPQNVVSATECTGLTQQPVMNEAEAQTLSSLCAVHPLKPQGNVGKGNPRNDPSEIEFHRTNDSPQE